VTGRDCVSRATAAGRYWRGRPQFQDSVTEAQVLAGHLTWTTVSCHGHLCIPMTGVDVTRWCV
jgi:hypothetical protein